MAKSKKRILRYMGFLVLLFSAIGFAEREQKAQVVKQVQVSIETPDEKPLVRNAELLSALANQFELGIDSQQLRNLNFDYLDSCLMANPFIEKATTFSSLHGVLRVEAIEQKPVLRIINQNNESYYLSDKGHKLPLSENYTPRVLVASGNIQESVFPTDSLKSETLRQLHSIAQYLEKNKLIKALAGQLFVNIDDDIVLITKQEERHDIIIGNDDRLAEKFDNLEQFYTKVLPVKGWDAYKSINLKYKNQIVAK